MAPFINDEDGLDQRWQECWEMAIQAMETMSEAERREFAPNDERFLLMLAQELYDTWEQYEGI